MPTVSFPELPGDARVWVFAADAPLAGAAAGTMLDAIDAFLADWAAHGTPLVAARDWRDDRFLAVGVDQSRAGASGCSIDGLFRALRSLEPELGVSLLTPGRVYWRDRAGGVQGGDRAALRVAAADGAVDGATPVFDTTVSAAADWRARFERPLAESWHARLVPTPSAAR